MMGGGEPNRTETIRQTTMPTEIIQKTITIEGDGNQLTAEELKDIIAKHAGEIGSSEIVTTVSEFSQFCSDRNALECGVRKGLSTKNYQKPKGHPYP